MRTWMIQPGISRRTLPVVTIFLMTLGACGQNATPTVDSSSVISLDGEWLLSTDPDNQGVQQEWFNGPQAGAVKSQVPWVIEDVFTGYHGVVWYWRDFMVPANPVPDGRYLLRFWNVDYLAEVWVNGKSVGGHEGAAGLFTLDVTSAVKPKESNCVAVRVLNPKDEPIDGIALKETPHRNKTCAFTFGCDYNHGGIVDSVELLIVPAVHLTDLFVQPNVETGTIKIQAGIENSLTTDASSLLDVSVASAAGGETVSVTSLQRNLPPGKTILETSLRVKNPRLWQLDDPYLYRVCTRVATGDKGAFHESSVRCGFRDFHVENGYFRLNGKRIFVRCSHTGNMVPIGISLPYQADYLRRDLINVKAMGFNAIRFISGPGERYQLDLCDEIGLMVYEEPYAAWLLADSPKMAARFDCSLSEMIRRDRNHPSVTIWGVLNETGDGPVFRHAVDSLPLVRSLDPSRLVLLSSGRFDCQLRIGSVANPGSSQWENLLGEEGNPRPDLKTIYPSPEGAGDAHIYPQVPHNADTIRLLRTYGEGGKNSFLTEYGIASAVDLVRLARQFEQRGKEANGEAVFYRKALDRFMQDWERWHMAECFGRPEDFFKASLATNAKDRLIGLNALRANPHFNGYSLTGTVDQGYSGEGLTTTFRELKPGMMDAMFDGLAPLRWCLFTEPVNSYQGKPVKIDVVLANEDVLLPGEYPIRIEVFSTDSQRVYEKCTKVTIPPASSGTPELPFAIPVYTEEVSAGWPAGTYRLTATFDKGGAAAGEEITFNIFDPRTQSPVDAEVVLWGEDAELTNWLREQGIAYRPFSSELQTSRELILVGSQPPAPGGAQVFTQLAQHMAHGSTVVFLSPSVFADGNDSSAWIPLAQKGAFVSLPSGIYHKDEWAKHHRFFNGLSEGGFLDYEVFRDTIGSQVWTGEDPKAEVVAAAIHGEPDYSSGSMISVHSFRAGWFILNTFRIRENLGRDPVADMLLRNMLHYGGSQLKDPLADLPSDFDQQIEKMGYK